MFVFYRVRWRRTAKVASAAWLRPPLGWKLKEPLFALSVLAECGNTTVQIDFEIRAVWSKDGNLRPAVLSV